MIYLIFSVSYLIQKIQNTRTIKLWIKFTWVDCIFFRIRFVGWNGSPIRIIGLFSLSQLGTQFIQVQLSAFQLFFLRSRGLFFGTFQFLQMSFPLRDSVQAERNECRFRTIKLRGEESGGDFYPPDNFEQWVGGGRCATPKIERKIVKRLKQKINWGSAHSIFVCRHARLFSINCYETDSNLKLLLTKWLDFTYCACRRSTWSMSVTQG